jgi:hypothetical protein
MGWCVVHAAFPSRVPNRLHAGTYARELLANHHVLQKSVLRLT